MIRHSRHSIRLQRFDYSLPGYYFVTICVTHHECLLGKVTKSQILLTDLGKIALQTIYKFRKYPTFNITQFVIMPNHIHLIIKILPCRGDSRIAPTLMPKKSLGRIIGMLKKVSTKAINLKSDIKYNHFWQRNYYEHIIRNESQYFAIKNYIHDNPLNWHKDEYNKL